MLGIQRYIDPKSPLYRKYPEELERLKVANFEYRQKLKDTSIPFIVNDLTNKGYKYYNLALREYTQSYNKQLKASDQIIKLKETIYQTLSLYIYKLNYIEDEAAYIQYANLKRQYKHNKYAEKNAIYKYYKQIVVLLTCALKDPIKQLQKQDKAFEEACRYSIIQVEKAKDQQRDLEKALSIFDIRIQVATYYYNYKEEIKYNKLQQKKVFDNLNVLIQKIFPKEGKKVTKGIFPIFASNNTNNDEGDSNESALERSSNKSQQIYTYSRSLTYTRSYSPKPYRKAPKGQKRYSSDYSPTYKVYNSSSHPIIYYYYIFPENTLVYIKLYIDLLARVKERLVVDKKLYKEVEWY